MRILWLGLSLALGAASANVSAAPYWVAWEGNDYPENEGWTRYNFGDGPAVRTLADGVMTIDSLWSFNVSDFCRIQRHIDPAPGEVFVAEWRMRVVEEYGNPLGTGDQGLTIAGDEGNTLSLRYRVNEIRSSYADWVIPIAPGGFHEYRVVTADMASFTLHINGSLALASTFEPQTLNAGFFSFGDAVNGRRSLVEWDYVRFGVIPEPSGLALLGMGLLVARSRDSSRKRGKT